MIKILLIDRINKQFEEGDESLLEKFSHNDKQWLWLDIEGQPSESESALLESRFGIHKLAISDAQRTRHPPKFETFSDHSFLLLRGLVEKAEDIYASTMQIALFLKPNVLITRHSERSKSVEAAWQELQNGKLDLSRGPSHAAMRVARKVVDRYTPILLALEDQLEDFEEKTISQPSDALLGELVSTNSQLKKLRRTLTYQKNVFSSMLHSESEAMDEQFKHECNDVFEQFERLSSLSTLYQELINDLINGYLSISAHRLNQIMKVLTIFTVIFLPLTVLAGIYGMNFEYMPELSWRYGYFTLLGIMLGLIVVSTLAVRRLRWL